MDNKNIASKRFYLAFIVGIAGLVLLIFCTFGFLYSGIKSELKARTDVAINLIGDRNNELFGELEILAGNIKAYQAQKNENEYARRNFYSQLVENTALQKKNFDAIFFIRLFGANEEVIASYNNDPQIVTLGELKVENFISKLKDGRYTSRFMHMASATRYFLIQRIDQSAYLVAFANTSSLNEKFENLGDVLLFNKDGEIYNISNSIFALYGQRFDFENTARLQILKKLDEMQFVYFDQFADSNNYVLASKSVFDFVNFKNILFLVVMGLFLIYLFLILINYKFLKSKVFAPLSFVTDSITSDNYRQISERVEKMGALEQIKEISKKLDETSKYSVSNTKIDFTFMDALKQSSLAILSINNKTGEINNASREAKEIYGDSIVGQNIFELESESLYNATLQRQMSLYTRENYVVVTHNTPNGPRDLYIRKTYVRNGMDIITLYIMLDASKYRKFYTDTRKRYEYLNYAPLITIVVNNDQITDVSATCREIWGYDNKKIINGDVDLWSLFKGDKANELRTEIHNYLSDTSVPAQNFKRKYEIRHSDNKFYSYVATIYIYKETKTVVMYFFNIEDSAEEIKKLNENLIFYRAVMDTRKFASCTVNFDNNTIALDKRFLEILGEGNKSLDDTFTFGRFSSYIYYADLAKFNNELNKCFINESDKIECEMRLRLEEKLPSKKSNENSEEDGTIIIEENAENEEEQKEIEGRYIWVSFQGVVRARNARKEAKTLVATIEDITYKKHTELELDLNANVFLQSLEAIVITDFTGSIIRANKAFYEIMQFSEEDVIGQVPEYFRIEHEDGIMGAIREKFKDGSLSYTDEIYCVKKNGEDFPALFSAVAIKDEFGLIVNYILMFTEISEIKKKESELVKIAHHDALTGLPNRIYIMNAAGEFLANAKKNSKLLAVLFIDFDGFKAINDNFGHDVGDLFLQEVSKTMSGLLRKGDVLARLGGDEFGAIIADLKDEKAAHTLLERLLSIADTKFNLDGNEVSASVSVGAAFYDGSEEVDFTELLSRADRAMYRAKTSGKNRYFIFDKENFDDLQISEERLKKSIENNEFFMLYQPIIEKERIYGYELLLRWKRENLGILLPSDFLFDIREPSLEILISKFSFTQMIKFNKETNLLSSINISLEVLKSDEFFKFVTRAIEKYQPKTEFCMFEITDFNDRTAGDFGLIRQRYADLGFKFALNNANMQNLNYLKGMPFDILKIDMRLCLDVAKKREGIKNLIDLIKSLRALKFDKIGAQGIENALSFRLLNNFKFDYMQGNYIAKALDRKDITTFIAKFKDKSSVKLITKDEFTSFLIALDYKNLALEFIESAENGEITDLGFEVFKAKFDEIAKRIQASPSQKFMLNTEIRKQILDILMLNFKNLQSFIISYKARVDKFIIKLEEA